MATIEALLGENTRLAKALDELKAAKALADELAREKVGHLERTVTELTRQSTNDAFQAARKCVPARASCRFGTRPAPNEVCDSVAARQARG